MTRNPPRNPAQIFTQDRSLQPPAHSPGPTTVEVTMATAVVEVAATSPGPDHLQEAAAVVVVATSPVTTATETHTVVGAPDRNPTDMAMVATATTHTATRMLRRTSEDPVVLSTGHSANTPSGRQPPWTAPKNTLLHALALIPLPPRGSVLCLPHPPGHRWGCPSTRHPPLVRLDVATNPTDTRRQERGGHPEVARPVPHTGTSDSVLISSETTFLVGS
ncbi:glycoprotein Xg isoform X7 [Saccopteryx leptura]|uniref:glycoprotein Xg isoform X7 n=1 Tax=Saccopteryx leptura TaxID=249018 RepID=UPI00339D0451